MLLSESLARRRFPGADALGQRLHLGRTDLPWYTVVGVVADVKQTSLAANEAELRSRLWVPVANHEQPLFVSAPLPQTARVMVKDENLCVHCGLCAERCPTAAWDMQKSEVLLPYPIKMLPMAAVTATPV